MASSEEVLWPHARLALDFDRIQPIAAIEHEVDLSDPLVEPAAIRLLSSSYRSPNEGAPLDTRLVAQAAATAPKAVEFTEIAAMRRSQPAWLWAESGSGVGRVDIASAGHCAGDTGEPASRCAAFATPRGSAPLRVQEQHLRLQVSAAGPRKLSKFTVQPGLAE